MISRWEVNYHTKKPKLKKPVFIEGLPGVGSVGKITVEFIIDQLDAKKLLSISSHSFPPSVFVNEEHLIELPSIDLYYAKAKDQDLLILSGDIQPNSTEGAYSFSEQILDILEEYKTSRIITLGGIALNQAPKRPQVYCTGNDVDEIARFSKNSAVNSRLYGVIGPIVGVSGILVGLAQRRKIPGITLLVETNGNPSHVGIDGSRELVKLLNDKLRLGMRMVTFEKETTQLRKDLEQSAKDIPTITPRENYFG